MAGTSSNAQNFDFDSQQSTSSNPITRDKKSWVWQHMTLEEDKEIVTCNICKKILRHKKSSGTGTLSRHLGTHNITSISEAQNTQQTQLVIKEGTIPGIQRFSKEKSRRSVSKLIVKEELPFSFAESSNLEEFVQDYQPLYRKIPRTTATNDIKKYYQETRDMLIAIFASCFFKFALTSDTWKALTNEHYICITAHWIDNDWQLQKRIIAFKRFEHPHTATNITKYITSTTREFGIMDRIFSISFDNASNNNASIRMLKEVFKPICDGIFFHNRCACHVLNLCVQDGLSLLENIVSPLRDSMQFIRTSSSRLQEFKRLCRENGKDYKKFKVDIKTRWNSTLHMLESIFEYENIITPFYNDNVCGGESTYYLSPNHFKMGREIVDILSLFETCTKLFSSTYFPTTHLILPNLVSILILFNSFKDDQYFGSMIHAMEIKFLKYYDDMPMLYCICCVLNPIFKFDGFERLINSFYELSSIPMDNILLIKQNTRNYLQQVFDLYEPLVHSASIPLSNLQEPSSSSSSSKRSKFDFMSVFSNTSSSSTNIRSGYTFSSEFMLYERTPTPPMHEINPNTWDILTWWRTNSHIFPVLSQIARDMLTVPVSTVASESAFSAGGRVLDEKRSRLSPKNLERLICLKDWLAAETRQQGMQEDVEDQEEDSSPSPPP